ncbi:hypothetical protein ACIA5E_08890 [Nocardia asteroides]|uniref:hypothetical protein n=1 Tax=Nocardia asteroides TaxID=1824 RepID=UPI0037BC4589
MLFAKPSVLRELKRIVVQDRGFGIMYGFVSIFLGLASVLVHNLWGWNWHTVVTVIAWLALLKGIYIIVWPTPSEKTDFEVRILTTRIALAIVGGLSVAVLIATYTA